MLVLDVMIIDTGLAEEECTSQRSKEVSLAYRASRISQLSADYFTRFTRDRWAAPSEKETVIGERWYIDLAGSFTFDDAMTDDLADSEEDDMTMVSRKSTAEQICAVVTFLVGDGVAPGRTPCATHLTGCIVAQDVAH